MRTMQEKFLEMSPEQLVAYETARKERRQRRKKKTTVTVVSPAYVGDGL